MDNQEIMNAIRLIADMCDNTKNCDACCLHGNKGCILYECNPLDWEIHGKDC